MRRWVRTASATVIAAVAVGALAGPSFAQEEIPSADVEVVHSWALSPAGSADPGESGNRPVFSYEAAPGAKIDDALTLFNYSNVPLAFELYATDAFNNESGAFDLLPGDEEPEEVGTWVALPTPSVIVPAKSQATMPFTVTVPADATPGDHAGAILASSVARGTGPDGKLVDLDRRTGSRMYIRVAGDLHPELAIENVETSYKPSLNPLSGTAEVTYRIRNRGNVRLSGSHDASIAGPLGFGRKTSASQGLPELLPGEEVTVKVSLKGVPAGVLDSTKVRLRPTPVDGTDGDLEPVGRSSLALALPVSVILIAIITALGLRARRQYRRRQGLAVRPHLEPNLR